MKDLQGFSPAGFWQNLFRGIGGGIDLTGTSDVNKETRVFLLAAERKTTSDLSDADRQGYLDLIGSGSY